MAGVRTGKDRDADYELSDPRKTELHCQMQILRKTSAAGLALPGVRGMLWEALKNASFFVL